MKPIKLFLIVISFLFLLFLLQKLSPPKNPLSENKITQIPTKESKSVAISSGEIPTIPLQLPKDFTIHIFTSGISNARDLAFSPGGTLLVSNPNNNQIIALPDKNHDGVADEKKIVIDGSNHPHGIVFYKDALFVAETNRVVRYAWDETKLQATLEKILFALPENNNHNNRTLSFDQNGTLYISVGSTCNVCNERSDKSATVMVSNSNGDNPRVFAKGLRNAAFTAIHPQTQQVWATEMGRDHLGDNTPPDEINILKNGGNYGWPLCYGKRIHDTNFDTSRTNPCGNTIAPIFEIPAHAAPLGLSFIQSSQFPNDWQNDLLVAYHGSWNRSTPIGYKVVRMHLQGNTITKSEDFLSGFLQKGQALGRPVDMIFDSSGNLYLSDDKAGSIYIIQKEE